MRSIYPYGTKERLFDLMKKVNKLDESYLPHNERLNVIKDFIKFVDVFLNLNNNLPKITLSNKSSDAVNLRSFGGYIPSKKEIYIVIANRNLADILRTLAHELVHWKQDLEGRLNENSGQTGSDEENEANSIAGIVLRNYGKKNPIIYE